MKDSRGKERRSLQRAEKILFDQGASAVFRTRGSHGAFDIIAVFPTHVKLIQAKSGQQYVSELEREAMQEIRVPANCSKEIWRFPDRKPLRVEIL